MRTYNVVVVGLQRDEHKARVNDVKKLVEKYVNLDQAKGTLDVQVHCFGLHQDEKYTYANPEWGTFTYHVAPPLPKESRTASLEKLASIAGISGEVDLAASDWSSPSLATIPPREIINPLRIGGKALVRWIISPLAYSGTNDTFPKSENQFFEYRRFESFIYDKPIFKLAAKYSGKGNDISYPLYKSASTFKDKTSQTTESGWVEVEKLMDLKAAKAEVKKMKQAK